MALQRTLVLHGSHSCTREEVRVDRPGAVHLGTVLRRSTLEAAAQLPPGAEGGTTGQGNTKKGIFRSWKGRAWRARPGSILQAQDRLPATPEVHAKRRAAPGAPSLERSMWTDAHQKELERQLGLQETPRLEGADLGQDIEPLPEAQGENLEAHRKKARKTALEYEQRQRRAATIQDCTPRPLTLDSGVFVAEACRTADLLSMLRRHRLQQVLHSWRTRPSRRPWWLWLPRWWAA